MENFGAQRWLELSLKINGNFPRNAWDFSHRKRFENRSYNAMIKSAKRYLAIVVFFLTGNFLWAQEVVREYYRSGELKGAGKAVNGRKEGTWIFYYRSGKTNAMEKYREGKLQVEATFYYPTEIM